VTKVFFEPTLRNWLGIILTIIIILPLDKFIWAFGDDATVSLLSLLKLGLLQRLPKYAQNLHLYLDRRTTNRIGYRLRSVVFLYSFIFLTVHLLACFWYLIGAAWIDYSWFYTKLGGRVGVEGLVLGEKYLFSAYWAVVTITTTGYGDISATGKLEMTFVIVTLLLAAVNNAAIIGSIAVTAEHRYKRSTRLMRVNDVLTAFMQSRRITPALRRKIQRYHFTVSTTETILDDREMPQMFKQQICSSLYMDTVSGFKFILKGSDACASFFRKLCALLEPSLYLAGEVVIRQGDIGQGMFFIHSGQCQVLVAAKKEEENGGLVVLTKNQYFGEIGIVLPQTVRTSSVVSLSDLETLILTRASWIELLRLFPREAPLIIGNICRKAQDDYPDLFDLIQQSKRRYKGAVLDEEKTVSEHESIPAKAEKIGALPVFSDRLDRKMKPPTAHDVYEHHVVVSSAKMHPRKGRMMRGGAGAN
jgi:CRP-like cAMP-binding protein